MGSIDASASGQFRIGDISINRLGYGAMRITGPGIWGAPSRDVAAARTSADLERIVNAATGPAGLMQMAHFDIGEVLRKELAKRAPKSVRLVIGNPLIMKEMVKHVPDAASYAPVLSKNDGWPMRNRLRCWRARCKTARADKHAHASPDLRHDLMRFQP